MLHMPSADNSVNGPQPHPLKDVPARVVPPPPRNILLGISSSHSSDIALRAASDIASQFDAALHVRQIVDCDVPRSQGEETLAILKTRVAPFIQQANQQDSLAVLPFANHFNNSEMGTAVALLEEARKAEASLIVLGAHKPNQSARRPLLGTLTQRVVREGTMPLLIAVNEPHTAYQSAILAIDFSPVSAAVLHQAETVAPHAAYHLVYFDQDGSDDARPGSAKAASSQQTRLRNFACQHFSPSAQERVTLSVTNGKPKHALPLLHDKIQPDLIVVGTSGREGLFSVKRGSVPQTLFDDPPCDILIAR